MCSGTSLNYKIMCFVVRKNQTKVQVTDKDIVCWKHVYPDGEDCTSEFRGFEYKKGKLNQQDALKEKEYNANEGLDEGFHSFLKRLAADYWWEARLRKFIIPKGSRYLIDPIKDEYISNQIIMARKKKSSKQFKFGS